MAQQRMQQNPSASGAVSLGVNDGAARMQSHGAPENQVHQVSQPGSSITSHDGGMISGQDSERSVAGDGCASSNSEPHQQSSSNISNGQNALRRSGALSFMASAASAFDAAKDIMEALRSKHTNLASELEVNYLMFLCLFFHGKSAVFKSLT